MEKINNKGITLIELIVSFAIVSVAMVYFYQTLYTVRKLYITAQNETQEFVDKDYAIRIVDRYIDGHTNETNLTGLCTNYNLKYNGNVCTKIAYTNSVEINRGTQKTYLNTIEIQWGSEKKVSFYKNLLVDNYSAWMFKLSSDGTITDYNYKKYGTDIKVPAEINGIPIKKITENSFKKGIGNVCLYYVIDPSNGVLLYYIIREKNEEKYNIIYNNIIKSYIEKQLSSDCGDDEQCLAKNEEKKSRLYICKNNEDNCNNLKNIEQGISNISSLPDSILYWQELEYDFDNNSMNLANSIMTSLDLSEAKNLETIESMAISNANLKKVIIPKNVEKVETQVFYNSNIETLVIEKYDPNVFISNKSGIAYGRGTFGYIGEIKNLTIESGDIGDYAFVVESSNKRTIENLIIGSGVKSIGKGAFKENLIRNLNLSEATSLTTIGEEAFQLNKISNLSLDSATSLRTIGKEAFQYNQISGKLVIPSKVTTIGDNAFESNEISSLDLSNATSLTTIGNKAFYFNQISGKLVIPSKVTTIGDEVFNGSRSEGISNLDLSSATSLTTIGKEAFQYNQISGKLVIPSKVTTIGEDAFHGNQISGLIIPSSVTIIGNYAFMANTLSSILIKMTKEDFSANVTVGRNWYDCYYDSKTGGCRNLTITYQP